MERQRSLIVVASFVTFVLLGAFFLYPSSQHGSPLISTTAGKTVFTAPRQNIWAEITADEADEIYAFTTKEFSHLNLTSSPKSAKDNSIVSVETLRPNKTDAGLYIFEDGHKPERYAKLILAENFDDGPYLVHYSIGPLPVSKATQISPLHYPFNSGRNRVRNPVQDFNAFIEFGFAVGSSVSDITEKLLGAKTDRDDPDGLQCMPRPSRIGARDSNLILWLQFFRPGFGSGGRTLLPQGIYAKVDVSGPNVNEWRVGQWFYNGNVYEDVDAFRAAVAAPDFVKTPPNLDGSWTDTEDFESDPPGRDLPPPVTVQPFGPRYRLDAKEKFVSWFGFEFYIVTAQATGVTLFDIRFNGERIMYELGLQEAMAHYAGDDPMAGGQEFLDTFFGMGKSMFELVPGYDCPAYADYLDSQFHMASQVHEQPSSICVFEFTADHLLSRHTAQFSVTASRNTYLVVRSVSTVGNYDYAVDYIFYMDGAVEVKVRASGYIFAAFYRANNTESEDEYGHRIGEAVSSSMHDHVINFKADLDVAGPTNDMVRLALEPTTKTYSWDLPEVPKRSTMHLQEYPVTHETGLDWPKNSGEFYIVYSADQKNAWGERKGYRITSGTGMGATPHLTILNSTTLGDSARWAEHDVWVLQRKDTEPRSADPLNYLEPLEPIINFEKMANHESLEHGAPDTSYDGDLVVYVNVGAHHIPHSGDIPNTLMHTSASSIMFVPHNFHDRDPSRASVQGVRLQLKGSQSGGFAGEIGNTDLRSRTPRRAVVKKTNATYFGATYDKDFKIPLEMMEPDLAAYTTSEHAVMDLNFNGTAAGVWAPN